MLLSVLFVPLFQLLFRQLTFCLLYFNNYTRFFKIGQRTRQPSSCPTNQPTEQPTMEPTGQPTMIPTMQPSMQPSVQPCEQVIFFFNSYDHDDFSLIMRCMIYLLTFLRILFNFLYFDLPMPTPHVSSTYGDRVKWTTIDATLEPLLVYWRNSSQSGEAIG